MHREGNCQACPLKDRQILNGHGPHGGLAVVGEAPGTSDIRRKRLASDSGGALLREVLRACGHDPDDVYYTSAVLRATPGNKTPTMTPIRACNDRLMEELAEVRPSKVLACGGVALTGVLKASRVLPITKMRGQAQWVDVGGHRTLLIPTINPALVLRDPNYFPDLLFDVEKFLRVDAPMPEPIVDTHIVTDFTDLFDHLQEMAQATVISCDLETYGFHPIKDPLLSVGFGVVDDVGNGQALIVPEEFVHSRPVRDLLWAFFTEVDVTFPFHNAKFDLQFLQHWFGDPFPKHVRVADTMLLHYLYDERPVGRYLGHGLKDISRTWYDVPDYHWDFEAFYATPREDRDYEGLYRYQGQDCVYTARLYFDLRERLEGEKRDEPGVGWFDPLSVHDKILVPGARAFAQAEYHGTYIDRPFFDNMGAQLQERLNINLAALKGEMGEEFNPGSPVQVSKVVSAMGAPGRHVASSVDRETLEALIRLWGKEDTRSGTLQRIIDFRNDQKVMQTYVSGLLEKVDDDGRIRPDFQLAGTATGRLSCRNPNFQNIPAYMAWNVRQGFAAPDPDHVFVEADYSQLELRVAAWLSQDPNLIEVFATGKDIHAEVAVAMFGKPAEEITSKERYMAKRVDFGLVYGRGAQALSEGPEMDYFVDELGGERWTVEAAEMYVNRFLDGFPRLREWIKETQTAAVRNQHVDTPLGRRRRFPYITKAGVWHTRNQAVNTPIQSVASDLCLQALTRVSERIHEFKGYVLFAVHDSIALEVPKKHVDRAAKIIRYEMEQNLSIDTRGIPFLCDIEVGPNWYQVEKWKAREKATQGMSRRPHAPVTGGVK